MTFNLKACKLLWLAILPHVTKVTKLVHIISHCIPEVQSTIHLFLTVQAAVTPTSVFPAPLLQVRKDSVTTSA